MNCEHVRDLIAPFVNRELGWIQSWRVNRHLNRCAVCRQDLESYRSLDFNMRAALDRQFELSSIDPKVLGLISREIEAVHSRRARRQFQIAVVLASVILITGIVAFWLVDRGHTSRIQLAFPADTTGTVSVDIGGHTVGYGTWSYQSPQLWSQTSTIKVSGFSGGFERTIQGSSTSGLASALEQALGEAGFETTPSTLTVGEVAAVVNQGKFARDGTSTLNAETLQLYRQPNSSATTTVGLQDGQLRWIQITDTDGNRVTLTLEQGGQRAQSPSG